MKTYDEKFPGFDAAMTYTAKRILATRTTGSDCLSIGGYNCLVGLLLSSSVNVFHVSQDQDEIIKMIESLNGPSISYWLDTELGVSMVPTVCALADMYHLDRGKKDQYHKLLDAGVNYLEPIPFGRNDAG